MIDGEDECAHKQGGPLRVHRSHLILRPLWMTGHSWLVGWWVEKN